VKSWLFHLVHAAVRRHPPPNRTGKNNASFKEKRPRSVEGGLTLPLLEDRKLGIA
jgi:hypothetical protein